MRVKKLIATFRHPAVVNVQNAELRHTDVCIAVCGSNETSTMFYTYVKLPTNLARCAADSAISVSVGV